MILATVTSIADGYWNLTTTWDTGTVPTVEDTVIIKHSVTISSDIAALVLLIDDGGSLTVADSVDYNSQITAELWHIGLIRILDDARTVRLDGVLFENVTPVISSLKWYDSLPDPGNSIEQNDARDVIISDPGYIGASCTLQDIKPEGGAIRGYARKVSNSVRYLTVSVMIRASMPFYLGKLYRMAEQPFQVLLVTNRSIIKGYIETVAPDASYVGTEYVALKVTVAEGL